MKRPAGGRSGLLARVAAFGSARVLVVGDLMVDRYYSGKVRRISPEAPVPVVEVVEEMQRFGGAANVALNLRSLGAAVEVCGVVGEDPEGRWLVEGLRAAGIGVAGVLAAPGRPTTLKCRVVAHHQQVVRFDRERAGALAHGLRRRVEEAVAAAWSRCGAVVVSDYAKGLVQRPLMRRIADLRRARGPKPVVVDPKSPHFELYRGATVVTPNLAEALAAARIRSGEGEELLRRAGAALLRRTRGAALLITRGEAGMSLFEPGRPPRHMPTVARAVFDVTGAGDTVVAVVGAALAGGAPLAAAARLANVAAGVVVGEFGTVPITREQLAAALSSTPGGAVARPPRGR